MYSTDSHPQQPFDAHWPCFLVSEPSYHGVKNGNAFPGHMHWFPLESGSVLMKGARLEFPDNPQGKQGPGRAAAQAASPRASPLKSPGEKLKPAPHTSHISQPQPQPGSAAPALAACFQCWGSRENRALVGLGCCSGQLILQNTPLGD